MREVIIRSSAKLSYQMGYMVVRGEHVDKIHIKEIELVIIESTAVSMTAALLSELIKNKVKVIFCDEKRLPSSELVPYYGAHDTSRKIRKQIAWPEAIQKEVWTAVITEKIKKQAALLEQCHKSEYSMLQGYADEILFADESNREGHAAKVYFNALFGMDFTREKDCPINAALNYGYSILLSSFARAIVANGYITQLGICHDNIYNSFNLASDLMEPYRPLVDRWVYLLQNDQCLEFFGKEQKQVMVNVLNQRVMINQRKELVSNAIQMYCSSVFRALEEADVSMIRFYENEL